MSLHVFGAGAQFEVCASPPAQVHTHPVLSHVHVPLLLQVRFPASGQLTLHARPPRPGSQVHVAPAQVPWPSQTTPPTVGHAMDTVSQAAPLHPAGQSQAPSTHVPRPPQTNPAASTGQGRPTVLPHAGPVYPA